MTAATRRFAVLGAVSMALAIGLGAFGAHLLRGRLDATLFQVYETAVHYHLLHSLGLIAVALAGLLHPRPSMLQAAGWAMLIGLLLFSGSLYLLAVTGIRWIGAVTPAGGIGLIAAWLMLAAALGFKEK